MLDVFRIAAAKMIMTLSESSGGSVDGTSLSDGLSAVGQFLQALWGWVAGMGEAITNHWILLIFVVGLPVAGFLTSFVFRLINRRR